MPKIVIEFVIADEEEAEEIVSNLNHKSDRWEALADLARTDFEFSAWTAPDDASIRTD